MNMILFFKSFKKHKGRPGMVGGSVPDSDTRLIEEHLIKHSVAWRHLDFSRENWDKEFGDGKIQTPIGVVKLGENQFEKLKHLKREHYFGLIKPTLQSPIYAISEIENDSEILKRQENSQHIERASKIKFIKTFMKPDGKHQGFCCVTVSQHGIEVSISSSPRRIKELAGIIKKGATILPGGNLYKGNRKPWVLEDSLQVGFLNETIPNEDSVYKSRVVVFFRERAA